jgi:glycosyltransferase involved in cell wall biosynthesis
MAVQNSAGFLCGGGRACNQAESDAGTMKPLRIAFVSVHPSLRRFRNDGSFIYRCENLALALSNIGHKVRLLHISALLFRSDFDVVVFLRPTRSWMFDHVVRRLRKRGIRLVADVDDLIFDPDCAAFRPSIRNGKTNQEEVRTSFARNAEAMAMMDKLVFSTPELARRYRKLYPQAVCTVIPNAGYRAWNAIAPNSDTGRNISYLVGTRTHDRDFSMVVPVLERLLERHPDLTVRLIGPLDVGLNHIRVKRLPRVRFDQYAQLVRDSHITIAPLEDTPFNQCKSAIKAIESAMMNVPTVASRVGDYVNIDTLGLLHAGSAEEWEAQLEFALEPANHRTLSEGLRERMQAYGDIDQLAVEFIEFVTN